ncbi:heterogeneous nuclear ribonucleoprotein U-like protein 2 [Sardina pilchardus]|uniref:heterogeneous nuclear ribonucleoprotein U-like protein 2 n=1 Tax=Sardina pilchardus TaxID=27697 RepID=UPI002E13A45A
MSDTVPVDMKLTDLKKLKVVELRVKLKERGLDSKGLKADLVARLWSALEHQSITEQQLPSGGDHGSSVTEEIHVDVEEQHGHISETLQKDVQPWETVVTGATTNICSAKRDSTNLEIQTYVTNVTSICDKESTAESSNVTVNVDCHVSSDRTVSCGTQQITFQQHEIEKSSSSISPDPAKESLSCHLTTSDVPTSEISHTAEWVHDATPGNHCLVAGEEDKPKISSPSFIHTNSSRAEDEHLQQLKSVDTISCGPTTPLKNQGESQSNKRPVEGIRDRGYYEFKEEVQYNRAKNPEFNTEVNEDNKVGDQLVVLDSYNSDLHFKVGEDGTSGQPLLWEKFPLLWSGCRLSHGVQYGKVSFEIKYVKRLVPCGLEEGMDPEAHVLRVGWSTDDPSLQLGETELSYAFDSRGRKVTQGWEVDFGEPFSEGDVISCYAWISDTEDSELSFYKNGLSLGVAFRLEPSQLEGHTLYPHVLCKNCSVSLNLDPVGAPWYCGPVGFTPLPTLQPHQRTRAPQPPASKEECEVVMMVGMPGSGKSRWARAIMAEHPDKRYSLLSTDSVLACMKGVGGAAQREVALQQAAQCLTQLIRVAAGRRRNYILDQANVYLSARRHKMLLFAGLRRRAVVVFPSDQEWKRRLAQQQRDQAKEVPEEALLKLKVTFTLPETGDLLEEVLFVELPKEEAQGVLTGYKEEARQALPSPPKRKKPRHKHNRAPPAGWRPWNTSYRRHPGWMNQPPLAPPPYWGPPPRQDMYGQQRFRNYYSYPTAQWNPYYGGPPGYFTDRNYSNGVGQWY